MSKANSVSRIEIVPVRDVFPHEAHDFTVWLEGHIDILAQRLGLELTVTGREQKAGDFSADLICSDASGRRIIIENQLERTNHTHLGQVLTYLVALEAKVAIWITTDPRPEHQRVVEWLNESMPADLSIYLVKIEATRIGNSPYGVLFSVLAAPDSKMKAIGQEKKEWADQDQRRFEFWTGLLTKSRTKNNYFNNISPTNRTYIGCGPGLGGCVFNFVIKSNAGCVEFYIDKRVEEENKALFDMLMHDRTAIETAFGSGLEWERLPSSRASRIRKTFDTGGLTTPEKWETLQTQMSDAMARLIGALRPRLDDVRQKIKIEERESA